MLSSSCGGDSYHQQQPIAAATTNYSSPTEFPSIDGISSGRSAALCALCRIVCSKHTNEQLRDDQLARFFALAHEALISVKQIFLRKDNGRFKEGKGLGIKGTNGDLKFIRDLKFVRA